MCARARACALVCVNVCECINSNMYVCVCVVLQLQWRRPGGPEWTGGVSGPCLRHPLGVSMDQHQVSFQCSSHCGNQKVSVILANLPRWPGGKASASGMEDLGSIPAFATDLFLG